MSVDIVSGLPSLENIVVLKGANVLYSPSSNFHLYENLTILSSKKLDVIGWPCSSFVPTAKTVGDSYGANLATEAKLSKTPAV